MAIKPFHGVRELEHGKRQSVAVVGLQYFPDDDEHRFVCIVDDGDGGIYVTTEATLLGALPYGMGQQPPNPHH